MRAQPVWTGLGLTSSTRSPDRPALPGDVVVEPDPHSGSTGAGKPRHSGHVGANGVTEALLTGDTAAKVKAAALAANPGATVERVENDAEGATYKAHIVKADGTQATVKLDAAFKVTATETGGPGH